MNLYNYIQRPIGCFLILISLSLSAGYCVGDLNLNLQQMPTPWQTPVECPSLAEYSETLQYWSETYPQRISYELRGQSAEGLPVYLVKITDNSVADEDKHIVLITNLRTGQQRSGGTATMALIEWLIGDSPTAQQTRKNHIVLIMPITNPWGFFDSVSPYNSQGVDIYKGKTEQGSQIWDINNLTLINPSLAPELVAYMSVVDQYCPEIQVDIHGSELKYAGHIAAPSIGGSIENYVLRPWDSRIVEQMLESANLDGYSAGRQEADAQRLLFGDQMQPLSNDYWKGRDAFYTPMYAYCKYHTMPIVLQIGWESEVIAMMKGLFEIGNNGFKNSPISGYPVNVAFSKYAGLKISAYGSTASERRISRKELWQVQQHFSLGSEYFYTDGREMLICTLNDNGVAAIGGSGNSGFEMIAKADMVANVRAISYMCSEAIEAFINSSPAGMSRYNFLFGKPGYSGTIQNGISISFKIFYPQPQIIDLRLNGYELAYSLTDGYQMWVEQGGSTIVQINIPPSRLLNEDVFIVTCAYDPVTTRGYGWPTPAMCGDANNPYPKGDFNQNCIVDYQDLIVLVNYWLQG